MIMAAAGPRTQKKVYTERDYYNTPENVHVELIDGIFYNKEFPNRIHQEILTGLLTMIFPYVKSKREFCEIYAGPFAVELFPNQKRHTIVEPDISVICDQKKLTDRGCTGAPDWIVEIVSPSNPSHDYIRKLNLYADAHVREYWIVDPARQKVVVYMLDRKNFTTETYTFQDKIKVGIFEDLYIDFGAMDLE